MLRSIYCLDQEDYEEIGIQYTLPKWNTTLIISSIQPLIWPSTGLDSLFSDALPTNTENMVNSLVNNLLHDFPKDHTVTQPVNDVTLNGLFNDVLKCLLAKPYLATYHLQRQSPKVMNTFSTHSQSDKLQLDGSFGASFRPHVEGEIMRLYCEYQQKGREFEEVPVQLELLKKTISAVMRLNDSRFMDEDMPHHVQTRLTLAAK
ncbi:hypothetical protein JVU11DRAFT_12444 [Chiua virens]|nr:hypothetical protein JVU11DRAFT_12444 [Chiua virens]